MWITWIVFQIRSTPCDLPVAQGAKIQLLDLPGIIEGAKDGKGRGKQAGPKHLMPMSLR